MCLTLGATLLAPTTEPQLVLYSKCPVVAPVRSDIYYMYLWINLVLLTELYMHPIHLPVGSEAISGLIGTLQQTATPRRV